MIVDNLCNSSEDTLNSIEEITGEKPDFYKVDLRDKEALGAIFQKYDFGWVIHFAWLKAVWESCEKPLEYFDNNLIGSIKLFECMELYNVKNIIFSSSATVYDGKNDIPFQEDQDLGTINPYGTTKLLIEKILEDMAKFSWFKVMNLRYFNPIGAHSSWLIGEDPEWLPNNLLPFIMKVANWDITKLEVFWNDYDTIDGTWVRDYIDVNDLIYGHILAYKKLETVSDSWVEVYNLGVGKGVSVLEMIEVAREVTWREIPYEIVWRREWDLWEVYCNGDRALKELWFSTRTPLIESLANSWKFIQQKST